MYSEDNDKSQKVCDTSGTVERIWGQNAEDKQPPILSLATV